MRNIRISTDIFWRVFHILTEPVWYTFVSVNRWNDEVRVHHSIDLRIQTDTELVLLKYGKFASRHKISVNIRTFFQCSTKTETRKLCRDRRINMKTHAGSDRQSQCIQRPMNCTRMSTVFGDGSSSRFPFRARTCRLIDLRRVVDATIITLAIRN